MSFLFNNFRYISPGSYIFCHLIPQTIGYPEGILYYFESLSISLQYYPVITNCIFLFIVLILQFTLGKRKIRIKIMSKYPCHDQAVCP